MPVIFFKPVKTKLFKPALLFPSALLFLFLLVWGINQWMWAAAPDIQSVGNTKEVGAYGPLLLNFSRDMDHESVEESFAIAPDWPGHWEWENDRKAWYWPSSALKPGTEIQVSLQPGMKTINGAILNTTTKKNFIIRSMQVVYIGNPLTGPELWKISLEENSTPLQITHTEGNVYDFVVSPDGENILYSRVNDQGGTDLSLIDRNGNGERILVTCGRQTCIQPAWGMNGTIVAYSKFDNTVFSDLDSASAHLYSVNTLSGESSLIFSDQDVTGAHPKFSPDGNTLGYYDYSDQAIHLFNLITSKSQVIPTQVDQVGNWSPDEKKMVFTEFSPDLLNPRLTIYQADLENKSIFEMDNLALGLLDFSLPEWSFDGKWMVAGVRTGNTQSNKQLWLLNNEGIFEKAITDKPLYAHASYHWMPTSDTLLYQRVELSKPNPIPEIAVWDMGTDQSRVLVENGSLPLWLP